MSGILMASVGNSYGSAPVNTVAPVVSGTATVGQTLSTTNGTWTGAPAPTFTYQWQRSGSNIGGATSNTYVLVAADYANTIRCVVTATNSVAPSGVSANSNSTAPVAGTAPVNTVAPAVTGTATFGQTLSCSTGTWTGTPASFTYAYQWQRVTTNISGATSSTYVLVAADVGSTIRCVVTATNAAGSTAANSNSTATVAATVPGAPTIGTATATTATAATVTYTAPASNGGATITLYTATSSPGGLTGTLATAGSGTITVSGLTTGTAYTFTVKATNSAGQSAASAASNSVTPVAIGQALYVGNGSSTATYSFIVPAGVTSISVVGVGAGGKGRGGFSAGTCPCTGDKQFYSGYGGGGGATGYANNFSVSPGNQLDISIGAAGTTNETRVWNASAGNAYILWLTGSNAQNGGTFYAAGSAAGAVGYAGGFSPLNLGTTAATASLSGGGSGAGGYAGVGGAGAASTGSAVAGTGGSGGGGVGNSSLPGGAGGGVGVLGQGSSGAAGGSVGVGGGGGSSGTSGASGATAGTFAAGGTYGGGTGGGTNGTGFGSNGGFGAIRIIYPGTTRQFPSTNTGDL